MRSTGHHWSGGLLRTFLHLISLSLLALPQAPCQLHSLDVSQYLHQSWTAQEGYFPGAGVTNNGIVQTVDGYIWILSINSLFRFDGARFTEWTPPNGESYPGTPNQLLASTDGSLWIGGQGVVQLRADGTWHHYHELDAMKRVRLAEDNSGVVWVGAEKSPTPTSTSLFYIAHEKVSAYQIPEFVGVGLYPLLADKQGTLWSGSEKGIWKIRPGKPRLLLRKKLPFPTLAEDSSGKLLYVDSGRIRSLLGEGVSEDYLGDLVRTALNVRTIIRDNEGALWIGTDGQGVVHLHEGRIDRYTILNGLSSDTVESIFQDHEGNVWVSTPESIEKFSKPAVSRLTQQQGLSGDAVYSVLTDRSNRTWIGTSDGFNLLVDGNVTRPAAQLHNDSGLAIVETNAGHLVMTTKSRNELDTRTRRTIQGMSGGSWLEGYKNVFSLVETRDKTLWAVSQELGLLHIGEDGNVIESFKDPEWGDYALSLISDPKRDGIWFTTHNGRVHFLKNGKILESYGKSGEFGHAPVRVLQVDDDGGVWLAALSGLAHLVNHKVSILGTQNGLPCGKIHWMRRDRDGQVWLYTSCGLVSFSADDLSIWIADSSHSVKITHYLNNTDGVENSTVGDWYAPLSQMTGDGRILFVMRTGLGILDPRHLNQNVLEPPVAIEGISADGHEVEHPEHALLPAKTGSIHISFTALSFAAPRKVKFRYLLHGYDTDWSPPVAQRETTYTNLPPGSYEFSVIACNNNGVWNTTGDSLDFVVLPAWYQTVWFRSFTALILVGILSVLYLIRIKRFEVQMHLRFTERMTERMRIARELHDTMLQALHGLVLSFSVYTTQVSASPGVQREMENALERADQLLIAGRNRIRDLRREPTEEESFAVEIQAIVDSLDTGSQSGVTLIFHDECQRINIVVQEEVLSIIREAMTNALRHSGSNELQIDVTCGKVELSVSIRDNGRGMTRSALFAQREGHFGLIGMEERAKSIGGRLDIQSELGRGTVVRISVPGRIAYRKRQSWMRSFTSFWRRTLTKQR